jgi:serine/threonine-protein kinase
VIKTELLNLSGDQQVFLRAVEKELAVFLGPLARVVVKRAASKTTDIDEMFRIMAQSLARDEDRDAFLARRVELEKTAPKTQFTREIPKPAAPLTSAINPMTPLGITPEAIDHAARALAAHVGPISAVLARKAAKRADSLRSLYVLLSEHVQDGKERRRFLREAGFPDA